MSGCSSASSLRMPSSSGGGGEPSLRPQYRPIAGWLRMRRSVSRTLRRNMSLSSGSGPSTGLASQKSFHAGVRQFTYSEEGGALRIWINGRRFVGARRQLGLPRIHAALPRPRIRRRRALPPRHELHHDPQLGGPDRRRRILRRLRPLRHRGVAGFLAGQPWDGPDPDDNAMFLRNVQRLRAAHPQPPLDRPLCAAATRASRPSPSTTASAQLLAELHPGMHYIPSSADGVVSGHGPYRAMPPKFYFQSAPPPSCTARWACPTSSRSTAWADDAGGRHVAAGRRVGHPRFHLDGAQGGAAFRSTHRQEPMAAPPTSPIG